MWISKDRRSSGGQGLAIGIALGVALGAAMDNMGAGIAIGVAIGAAMGSGGRGRKSKSSSPDGDESNGDPRS